MIYPDTEIKSLVFDEILVLRTRTRTVKTNYVRKSDSEVNIQFGEFALKKHRVEVLHGSIAKMRDCIAVFGEVIASAGIASAEVQHTSNRLWYRLQVRRHDLQVESRQSNA